MCIKKAYKKHGYKQPVLIILLTLLISACSTVQEAEIQSGREQRDTMADQALAAMIKQNPALKESVDAAPAYMIVDMKLTKVPIVGAGAGQGVFINKQSGKRTYVDVKRLDLGGGVGARVFKIMLVFEDEAIVPKWENGTWEFQAGVEASAGDMAAEGASGDDTGFSMHTLAEAGASATATARAIRIKVNRELTNY